VSDARYQGAESRQFFGADQLVECFLQLGQRVFELLVGFGQFSGALVHPALKRLVEFLDLALCFEQRRDIDCRDQQAGGHLHCHRADVDMAVAYGAIVRAQAHFSALD